MSERWRLFVAVPIGAGLRASLAAAVTGWRGRPDLASLRWTDPTAWHLTLAFLGATDAADVGRLADALERVARDHAPMTLVTGGLGAFPSAGRARVAWYGVADPDRRLGRLARDVRDALGGEAAARFRPHLTLGRARAEPVDLRAWITSAGAPEGRLQTAEIDLMRSHLGRGPARYETVASVRLETPAHV